MTIDELRHEQRPLLPAEPVLRLFASRSQGYELLKRGQFPLTPIRVGRKILFATCEVRRVLNIEPAEPGAAR